MKHKTGTVTLLILTAMLNASCGLLDIDSNDSLPKAMQLDRHTAYLMVGDQLELHPAFTPDDESNIGVLWTSSDDNVLSVGENMFNALSPGTSMVRAFSTDGLMEDSCLVYVMRRWEMTDAEYPYEMLVYAKVTVHGQPFDPATMMLGAFVDDEMRGAGELMEWQGQTYVRFRIGSDMRYYDPEGISETVTFRVYNRHELLYEEFPQTLEYDGEAHGTLTNLYQLSL